MIHLISPAVQLFLTVFTRSISFVKLQLLTLIRLVLFLFREEKQLQLSLIDLEGLRQVSIWTVNDCAESWQKLTFEI